METLNKQTKNAIQATDQLPSIDDSLPGSEIESIEITIGTKGYVEKLQSLIDKHGEKFPFIKATVIPITDEQIISNLRSGQDLPDLILSNDEMIVKYAEMDLDRFAKLKDYFDEYVFQNFKLGELIHSDGEIYGIPFSSGVVAFYYRKDIMDEHGISIEDEITWDELIDKAIKLKDSDNKFILPFPTSIDTKILMKSQGLCFYNESGEVTPNGSLEIMSFYENLAQKGLIYYSPELNEENGLIDKLRDGEVVGIIRPPYILNLLPKFNSLDEEIEWGVAEIPKSDTFNFNVNVGGESWLMTKHESEEHNQIVAQWLKEVILDNMLPIVEDQKIVPVESSMIEKCNELDIDERFGINVISYLANIGADNPIVLHGPYSEELLQILYDYVTKIVYSQISVDEAYSRFSDYIESEGYLGYGGSGGSSSSGPVIGPGGDAGLYYVYMEISKLPNKTTYTEGESFNKNGMKVNLVETTLGTNKKTYHEINNFGVDKQGGLKRTDDTVIISCTYNKVRYAAPVKIKVKPVTANIKNKASNAFGDFPKVNLLTGNIMHECGDISIGANRYEISVSHVYNSDAIRFYKEKDTGLGNGWKLNLQQYILNIDDSLYYIDANGYMHEFKSNSTAGLEDVYLDVDGEGLTLCKNYFFEDANDYYLLSDSAGNYIIFDSDGRMIRMLSAPCPMYNISKARAIVVEYLNNKINRVYDTYNSNIYLYFEYKNSFLSKIKAINSGDILKTVSFAYSDDGNLISRTMGDIIEEYHYTVFGSLLTSIDSKETKSAVQINYKNNSNIVESCSVGYRNSEGSFIEKSRNSFSYSTNADGLTVQTEVRNDKDICIVYMFNSLGEIVSSFEKTNSGLRTLQNETGKKLTNASSSSYSESINGKVTVTCTEAYKHSGEISLYREGEKDIRNFAVTCYVKLKDEAVNNLQAVIKYTYNFKTYVESVKIDNNAVGVWQRVSVPLAIQEDNSVDDIKITSFSFGIYDGNGKNVEFSRGDIYVLPCSSSTMLLTKSNISSELKNVTSVKITTADGKEQSLSLGKKINVNGVNILVRDIPLTFNDLLETAKSMYRNQLRYAEFFYAGGKNRIYGVKNVKLVTEEGEFELINLSTGKCNFIFEQYSTDNTSRTQIKTQYKPDEVLSETTIIMDGKSSTTKTLTSYDGRKLYEEDAYGVRTQYEYDNYYNLKEVRRVILDNNGDVDQKIILWQSQYDAQGTYLNNTSSGFSSSAYDYNKPFSTIVKETERSFDLSTGTYTPTKLIKNVVYDKNGRVKSVSLKDDNNEIFRNDVTYSEGKIRTVTDGSVKYGIKYDAVNDETTYTVFDGENEVNLQKHKQTYDSANKQFIDTDRYYHNSKSNNATETITAVSDRYGKALSLSDGQKTVEYNYIDSNSEEYKDKFLGYNGAQLIDKVTDPYEGRDYKYKYNHDGQMCGWKISDGSLSIQQISATETKYTFKGNSKYKTQTLYDEKVVNQPRIMGTKIYFDNDTNNTDNWTELREFSTEYGYDDIGRINSKSIGYYSSYSYYYLTATDGSLMPNIKTVSYEYTIPVNYNQSNTAVRCIYKYSYDNRGNINSIVENNIINNVNSNIVNSLTTYEYGYDNANRITSEKITEGTTVKLNRKYEYLTSGNGNKLSCIKDIDKEGYTYPTNFYYNNRGQIAKYVKDNRVREYVYDNYGNVIRKNDDNKRDYNCYWERGNLLKRVDKFGWDMVDYEYNHKNVRFKKKVGDAETEYYLDGAKILGEDRSDGTEIRYFYDNDGLVGFTYNDERYNYIKDGQNNVTGIVYASGENGGTLVARYEYDSFGNTTVKNLVGEIGNINPFRWKSFYYDVETGFYYANGRYYEPARGGYIDAIEADIVERNAYNLLGLDRNGIMCLTLLMLAPYSETIATVLQLVADPTYDPNIKLTWWDKHGLQVILNSLSILAGVIMLATGNPGGVLMILSGAIGIVGAVINEQLAGAASMAMLGIQTIAIGVKCLNCCTPYGIIALAVGAACVAFATAEAQEALGYGNWMKDGLGMSDDWYTGLMVTANVAAIAINLVGVKQCFKEGTLVQTEDGLKPIEEIQVGDRVLAYDEETGGQAYKKVVQLFRNQTNEWYHIFVNGEEIICTGGHPFYVAELDKFIPARELTSGTKLLLSTGACAIIEAIQVEHIEEPETTYNFEVEDFHTYYVTESKVLVHNMCKESFDPKTYSSGKVKMNNGKVGYVQDSGIHAGNIVSPDTAGHAGSTFKLYKEIGGNRTKLMGDLDEFGNVITGKHSSNLNKIYRIVSRR